jgi:hypothetical protein
VRIGPNSVRSEVQGQSSSVWGSGPVRHESQFRLLIVPFGYWRGMSSNHEISEDIVFDLVSIQYHALQGSHLYQRFLEDAKQAEHPEVEGFIREVQEADRRRAVRCHELLVELTADTTTS